MKESSRIDF